MVSFGGDRESGWSEGEEEAAAADRSDSDNDSVYAALAAGSGRNA